jgi:exodeoxyribonuclease V alpha subunit
MQLVNNYEKEVFNGDQGIITWVNPHEPAVRVRFDEGREHTYTKKELNELSLSYVCSIHKVQGSEYPCVILIMMNAHYALLKRSLLYTALTRGKKLTVLIGQRRAYQMAIRDNGGRNRFTTLPDRLKMWQELSDTNSDA